MKFLLILNGALAALALTLGLVEGVVCVLYASTLDVSPKLGDQLPLLLQSTAVFLVLGGVFAVGFYALLRRKPWRWWSQLACVAALPPALILLYRLFN